MNDLTPQEEEVLCSLKKPVLKFNLLRARVDLEAQRMGYKNHENFLTSTGQHERFTFRDNE